MEIPQRLIDVYVKASKERLEKMSTILEKLRVSPEDNSDYATLRGIFHEFSGASAMFGFAWVGDVSQDVELAMNKLIDNDHRMTSECVEMLVKIEDFITHSFNCEEIDEKAFHKTAEELREALRNC